MAVYSDYLMGFRVNGTPMPDPTAFSGAVSDLDVFGERDIRGDLHRKRVATKEPLKFSYQNIPYSEAIAILAMTSGESFQFTFRSMKTGEVRTMKAYRGADANYTYTQCFNGQFASQSGRRENCLVNLDFSIIEY